MKRLLTLLLVLVLLLSSCTPQDPLTRIGGDPLYIGGSLYTWNGTAYQLVNTNLGGNSSGVTNHALLTNLSYASANHTGFQQELGYTPENTANKGIAGGYASLNATGKLPHSQIDFPLLPNATLISTDNQTSGGVGTANLVTFNNHPQLAGITHSTSSNTSQIWTQEAGAYLVTFSAVVEASVVNKHIDIWVRKNGTNITNSNTRYELPLSGESLVTVTFIEQLSSGEYVELVWASTDDANMKLLSTIAASSPSRPASPSVIMTINKVSR